MKKLVLATFVMAAATMANAANLHPQCEEYFKAIDAYVAKAPEALKAQLNASKDQMSALPKEAQEMACKQGLEALKQLPKM